MDRLAEAGRAFSPQRMAPIYRSVRGLDRRSPGGAHHDRIRVQTRMCFFHQRLDGGERDGRASSSGFGNVRRPACCWRKRSSGKEDAQAGTDHLRTLRISKPFEDLHPANPSAARLRFVRSQPFIFGIFFPVFFGMILGDAGTGCCSPQCRGT